MYVCVSKKTLEYEEGQRMRESFFFIPFQIHPIPGIKQMEDIYFFEMNSKYSSSYVLKILVISRVCSTSAYHEWNWWFFQHIR